MLIGDGVQVSMTANILQGLQICFKIDQDPNSTDLEADSVDIAIANGDFSSFKVLGITSDPSQRYLNFLIDLSLTCFV